MATPLDSDTRQLTRDAAEKLTAEGRKVSVRSIREITGKGSDTTIAAELKRWRSAELARRSTAPDESWPGLPLSLQQEAQALYLRILGAVSEKFSKSSASQAQAIHRAGQQTLAALEQLEKTTDLGTAATRELLSSLEDRAKLSALLQERDIQLAEMTQNRASQVEQIAALSLELTDSKVKGAEREVQAYARAEGLSKHLYRMTEEQRANIAAPLANLNERYEGLQMRENLIVQQLNAAREEIATLKRTLANRQNS